MTNAYKAEQPALLCTVYIIIIERAHKQGGTFKMQRYTFFYKTEEFPNKFICFAANRQTLLH